MPIEELESELERQRRISLSEREALVEEHAASLRRLELQFESREAEFEAARWVTHSPHTQPTSQPASQPATPRTTGMLAQLSPDTQALLYTPSLPMWHYYYYYSFVR